MTGKDYKILKSKSNVSTILKSITDRIEDIEMRTVKSESSITGTIAVTDEVPTSYLEEIYVSPDDPFVSDEDISSTYLRRAGRFIEGYVELSSDDVGAIFVEVTDGQLLTDLSIGDKIFLVSNNDNKISLEIEVSSLSGSDWQYIIFDSAVTVYEGTNRIVKMYNDTETSPDTFGVYSYLEYATTQANLISVGASVRFKIEDWVDAEMSTIRANKFYGSTSEDAYSETISIGGALSTDKNYNTSIVRIESVPNATDDIVYSYRNGSYLIPTLDEDRYSSYDQTQFHPKQFNIPVTTNLFTTADIESLLGGTITTSTNIVFIPESMIDQIDYGEFTYVGGEFEEDSGWEIGLVDSVYASTFDTTSVIPAGKYYISYAPYGLYLAVPSRLSEAYSFAKVVKITDEYSTDDGNVKGILLSSPIVLELTYSAGATTTTNFVQEVVT